MPINIPLTKLKRGFTPLTGLKRGFTPLEELPSERQIVPTKPKSTLDFLIPSLKETISEYKWLPKSIRPYAQKFGEFLTPESKEEELAMMVMGASGGLGKIGPKAAKIVGKERITMEAKALVKRGIQKTKEANTIQKVINALKEAKPLRGLQERLYTKARGAKLAKMLGVAKKTTGEAGFFAEKGALKGELPKVQFESIRKKIGQTDIDTLFNKVKASPILTEWEKIPAREGLSKIFGEVGGK
ncbi:hypothetical protein LCGC14_2302780, partial [marine sediment metagenome]